MDIFEPVFSFLRSNIATGSSCRMVGSTCFVVALTSTISNMWAMLYLGSHRHISDIPPSELKHQISVNPCMRIWFIAPTHPHKHTQTYFLSIRTWTFRLLTRLSLLWRFWETEQNDRTESEKVTGNSNWVHWFVVVFFMTKFLFKGISHQLTEYARRDDNAVTVQNEEGFSWVKPQTLRQTSTSLHDDTSLSRLIDLLFISVCETESLLLS